ncbi:hypothetical protein ACFO5O_14410 [Geojedonia litorea]|uniref:Uncharacterized protein n=1 Tax=Geojedonia litorea TaxID=1268269 RepID=A0ABV9N7D0_9FLAO
MNYKICFLFVLILGSVFVTACKEEDDAPAQSNTIIYKLDGRSVKLGDQLPIAVDLSEDGQVDFAIFVELTANSQGDRLYAGVNPIGENLIKSGPAIDTNFLNMGLLIAELEGERIDFNLNSNQRWTSDHSALVIRNTLNNGETSYEGNWANSKQIVGIQNRINEAVYFGWLRIEFDKQTEIVTLIDYAYNHIKNESIFAGAKSN